MIVRRQERMSVDCESYARIRNCRAQPEELVTIVAYESSLSNHQYHDHNKQRHQVDGIIVRPLASSTIRCSGQLYP